MATYYVRKTGNNGNAGTSSGAAWQTIGKALTTVTSGDTVYVGAGVYRETVTVTITPASLVTLIADTDGSQTGDMGEVRWTAFTTDDKTSPSASALLTLSGKSYLKFQNFVMQNGTGLLVDATTNSSTNITFQDCTFIHYGNASKCFSVSAATMVAPTWTWDRCRFLFSTTQDIIYFSIANSGSPVDTANVIKNCLFMGYCAACIDLTGSGGGSGANNPGGTSVLNNTFIGGGTFLITATWNTTTKAKAYNNVIVANNGFNSGVNGQQILDYNHLWCPSTGYANTTAGSNDKSGNSYAMLFHVGQELQQGKMLRPHMMPCVDSGTLGYGNDATNHSGSVDILNRARPSGGGVTWSTANKSPGCYERHDFGVKETSTYDVSPSSLKFTGPGDQEIQIPVDATSTTISIKTQWDGNYGAGTKPQVTLVANGEIGVSTETVTATGSSGVFNTIALSGFTPTGKGWVTIRLISNAAGNGIVYWDTLSVS